MNLIDTPLMQRLSHFLDATAMRSGVIAGNITNVDTPGYHARDVDFRSQPAALMNDERSNGLNDGNGSGAQAGLRVVEVPGLTERPDGNNVNIDREDLALGQAQLQFQTGIALLKSWLHRLSQAIQTDGYAAYDHVGGARLVHAACWAHARRAFFEAVQLNREDVTATPIVAWIDELFATDARAREQKLDHAARHMLRQQCAPRLLDKIRGEIERRQSSTLPASALGKACRYTLALWTKLTRFLEHPELELINNRAENSMRPVAVGRNNWVHVGSAQAGPKIAAILSVVESCRRMQIPVREYLAAVLPGLNNLSIQSLAQLTPTAWAVRNN